MRAALLQLTVSDTPADNAQMVVGQIARAAAQGAGFVLTPEVSNGIIQGADRREALLRLEEEDDTLRLLQAAAQQAGVWLLIGSLALKTGEEDGRLANRSFLIDPGGHITARYDKIHMFDAAPGPGEQYLESAAYRPGDRAAVAQTPFAALGMTICYDLRFPRLYRDLAQAGADVITVPSAFSPTTGAAHWESLLRARAIETGAYILAPAQTGQHPGTSRTSYGHTMAIDPWGRVLADAGKACGITFVDLDRAKVQQARQRVASLAHDRGYKGP